MSGTWWSYLTCLKDITDNNLECQASARNKVLSKHLWTEDGLEQQ